jgi:hypothetical protein
VKDTSSPASQQTHNALSRLLSVLRKKYPDVSESQAEHLQGKVLNYVSDGLSDGYDLALIKRKDDRTVLKVLKLMEEEDTP